MNKKIFQDNLALLDHYKEIAKDIRTSIGVGFHTDFYFMRALVDMLGLDSNIAYLEIGCFAGVSAAFMAQRKNTHVVSVDMGSPIPMSDACSNVKKFIDPTSSFVYVCGDSHHKDTLKKVVGNFPFYDILFIDGDHSCGGVKKDFRDYSPLVKPGGYLIFDDYNDYRFSPEVKPAVDSILSSIDTDLWSVLGCIPTDDNNCFTLRRTSVQK